MVAHWCQSNKIKIEQIKKIFRKKAYQIIMAHECQNLMKNVFIQKEKKSTMAHECQI